MCVSEAWNDSGKTFKEDTDSLLVVDVLVQNDGLIIRRKKKREEYIIRIRTVALFTMEKIYEKKEELISTAIQQRKSIEVVLIN